MPGESEQQISIAQVALLPAQDGSAVVQFIFLGGAFMTQTVVPRQAVEDFIRKYHQMLKTNADILRVVSNGR